MLVIATVSMKFLNLNVWWCSVWDKICGQNLSDKICRISGGVYPFFNCIELRKKMKAWNIIYLAILKILKLYILYTIWTSRPEYFLWNPTSSAPTSSISEFFRFWCLHDFTIWILEIFENLSARNHAFLFEILTIFVISSPILYLHEGDEIYKIRYNI